MQRDCTSKRIWDRIPSKVVDSFCRIIFFFVFDSFEISSLFLFNLEKYRDFHLFVVFNILIKKNKNI